MQRLPNLLAAFMAILLTGCSTNPVAVKDATDVPAERVLWHTQAGNNSDLSKAVIIRDKGLPGAACFYALWIDGVIAARFNPGEKTTLMVNPGERVLKVGNDPQRKGLCALVPDDWTQRESVFKPAESKFFRLRIDENGKADIERTDP